MIHGLDTGFLVAAEIEEHPQYGLARAVLARVLAANDQIAIAPQVLAEFIHIATDSRRFSRPLDTVDAHRVAEAWWTAGDAVHVFPDNDSVRAFLDWMKRYTLGRRRLLDTMLAATYYLPREHSFAAYDERSRFSSLRCFQLCHSGFRELRFG